MKLLTIANTKIALFAAVLTAGMLLGTLPAEALTPSNYPAGAAANGIEGTRHNLGAYGRVLNTFKTGDAMPVLPYGYPQPSGTAGTTEICVFCHTPHHAANTAPLWNKGTQSTNYKAYGTTVAGTNIADNDIGGATLACLSCHDGVNAFDTLANAPGKGNGGDNNTTARNFDWYFMMPDKQWPSDKHDTFSSSTCTSCHEYDPLSPSPAEFASGGTGSPGNRLSVGTDLTNDHPVSVPYQQNKASLRDTGTVISDILMTTAVFTVGDDDESDSSTTTANRWAVKGYINTSATIADLLRGPDNKVECSSCHDPHFDNRSWDEVESTWVPLWWSDAPAPYWCTGGDDCTDGNFLRRVGGNSVSGVCRTCHNKD